jgi:hypothetical protein
MSNDVRYFTPSKPFQKRQKISMPKQKRWSHQDDLEGLVGKNITVSILDIGHVNGTLMAADQFTLKLKIQNADKVLFRTFFKSALTYYNEA